MGTTLFLGCDWGTSRLRLRLATRHPVAVLAEYASDRGCRTLAAAPERPAAYAVALAEARGHLAAESGREVAGLPVVISGMAGSSIGWREVPYAALPWRLDGSDWSAVTVPPGALPAAGPAWGPVTILGGVAAADDVMRGEETELLGLLAALPAHPWREEALVLLPGTHCKHLDLGGDRLTGLRTAMSGELFEVLARHSVLRASVVPPGHLEPARGDGPAGSEGFLAGVALAREMDLPRALFQVRARALLAHWDPERCAGFLSGLCLGAELRGLARDARPLLLAAGGPLAERYTLALAALGHGSRLTAVPAAEAALAALRGQALWLDRHGA